MSWVKAKNFDNIQVESDSLQVVQSINSSRGFSSFHLIIRNIENMMNDFSNVFLSFTKRLANRATHKLVKQSVSIFNYTELFDNLSSIICDVLSSSLN